MFVVMRYVPRRATQTAIRRRMVDVAKQAGLREGRDGKRYRVPLMNGFRRFFNKTCKEALSGGSTLGSLIKHEFMLGHSGFASLDENYKTDALEMAAEYVKAVPDLTIDDAERLRRSNRAMSENIQALEDEKDCKIARMEGEMARMAGERDAEAARMKSEAARVGREKDEVVERMRDEVAELKGRRERPVSDKFMESLTGMLRQLGHPRRQPCGICGTSTTPRWRIWCAAWAACPKVGGGPARATTTCARRRHGRGAPRMYGTARLGNGPASGAF